MATPDAKFELQIGGVWTEAPVRMASRITHSRGRRNKGSRVDAAEVGLTLESPDGLYNNRNPRSPYFGLLGRNTPARLSVESGVRALVLPGASADRATTPDHASLDITGDIDVRVDVTLSSSRLTTELAGKYDIDAGNQRSWLFELQNTGALLFVWSPDGTFASRIAVASTEHVTTYPNGRLAMRATLDVNNGSGGNTVTFYTAPTMDGTWVQLGAPVVTAGVTSVFASTATVELGGVENILDTSLTGRIHAFELRSGIAGSVVANPDFTAQAEGATSFADGAGRTWTVEGAAQITSRRVRCRGEVSKWPPKWHVSGHNITAPITAAGIKRRLEAGRKSLQSTLRRRVPSDASCVAYWPMEEESQAIQAYSPIEGVPVLRTVNLDYGSDDTLLGSSALPTLIAGTTISMDATVPDHTATGNWMVSYVYYMEAAPAASTEILEFQVAGGTVRRIVVLMEPGGIAFNGYDADGTQVISQAGIAVDFYRQWNRLEVIATTTGGNVNYHLGWISVSGGGSFMAQSIAATAGTVKRINTHFGAPAVGFKLGHLGVFNSNDTQIYNGADDGFQGETAADRIVRLTEEEGIPAVVHGGDSMAMGAQRPNQLLTVLEECEDSDGGILYEQADQLALAYRPRVSMYNQPPTLTLDYGQLTQPFEPVEEDSIRNDITVTREGGSSARVQQLTGPNSIHEHPDGIGPYEGDATLSLYADEQCLQVAAWLVHLSTWDEARYPRVRLLLHKYPELIPDVVDLVEGDIIRITNLPDHLPPGPIDLMIEGFEERFGEFEWEIVFVCSPGGPWTVGVLDDPVLGRLDTDGSELAVAVDADDTAWTVNVTDGPQWITTAAFGSEFPFDLMIGGERVTVSAITSSVLDTFTRSVTDGWGSPNIGAAWTNSGGTAANFDVTGTTGTHTMTTVNVSRLSLIPQVTPDFDLMVDVASNDLASGAGQLVGLAARAVDVNNQYHCYAEFTTAAAVVLKLRKAVAGVVTELGTFTSTLTHVAGTFYRIRFQGRGSLLRARIWAVTATEPDVWHIWVTDTALTAAANQGVRSVLATGNTDVSPVMSYDNFQALTPQLFTVVRSVNGISKSHAAGAPVSLADPMRIAL